MNKFIKSILYDLKKDYGRPIDIYKITSVSNNLETGVAIKTRTKYPIKKAILLPKSYITNKIYALSYIAANKNFTYGGFFNEDIKVFLIDGSDIDIEIKLEDYIIEKDKRYEIKQTEDLEDGMGYILICKYLEGSIPYQIHDLKIYHKLRFNHLIQQELE